MPEGAHHDVTLPTPGSRRHLGPMRLLGVMSVVAAIVLISHGRALRSQAVCIDDRQFFTDNHLVQNPSWASMWRFLAEVRHPSTVEGYYQPLTMISLMADRAMGARSDDLTVAHIDSLTLHVLTTLCVLLLVHELFGNLTLAAIAALLFGVHPLTVELAVWIGQRKAVLAGLFTTACLWCFVCWVRRRTATWYVASVAALALALLSKPSAVPAPALLLTLDFWPLRRLHWRTLIEKIPHFAIAGVGGVVSIISHAPTVGFGAHADLSLPQKALLACGKIGFFVEKVLLPRGLTVYYPGPRPISLDQPIIIKGVIVTAALLAVALITLRWTRAAAAGIAFFVIALGPVLGFVGFSEVFAFDNYAYIALIGPALLLAGAMRCLFRAVPADLASVQTRSQAAPRAVVGLAVLAVTALFIARNRAYLDHWTDTERLYAHMIRLAPTAPVLHKNLGAHYYRMGEFSKARRAFETALHLHGADWQNHLNLALVMQSQGEIELPRHHLRIAAQGAPRLPAERQLLATTLLRASLAAEAVPHLQALAAANPGHAPHQRNLAAALAASGRLDQAVPIWQALLQVEPDQVDVHADLALGLSMLGRVEEAMSHALRAIAIEPTRAPSHSNLGMVQVRAGRLDDAAASFERALELDGSLLPALEQLAIIRVRQQRPAQAMDAANRILALRPNSATAMVLLGDVHRYQGDMTQAMGAYRRAIEAEPENPAGHFAHGMALAAVGRPADARQALEEALRLNPAHEGARRALQALP